MPPLRRAECCVHAGHASAHDDDFLSAFRGGESFLDRALHGEGIHGAHAVKADFGGHNQFLALDF